MIATTLTAILWLLCGVFALGTVGVCMFMLVVFLLELMEVLE